MSKEEISDNVEQVYNLVRKSEGIISTFNANEIEKEAKTVESDYKEFAETHVSLGDTTGFETNVYESLVQDDNPTKGYLYGPFGYGKTSTSVSIWKTLSENDVIAVPPFTLTSFASIMRATYGWMHYELENKAPKYVSDLEEIQEEYLQQELRSYAETKKDEHQFSDTDQLVKMFEEMERSNDLDLTIQADTLIDFFHDCTELALEAEFEGLIVLGDEFQQYFKSADNRQEAESRFRNLVFGLQAGASIQDEFGLFISMPEQTKSTLDAHAGDVLNRFENDNLTINLKNVYGQNFPIELWNRYAEEYGFKDEVYNIITESALDSIGQICKRPDLSNGPRTVIDIFRIALDQYQRSGDPFTVLDLAEAFYEGEVRYQGSSTKIQSAIGDALGHSAVDTIKKEQFIQICAVFPEEGIPSAVVDEYDLTDAKEALSKALHGEVIKVVAEGYTLIDVTAREGPTDIVQQLIRDFWRQYDTDHVNAEYALSAFANDLICGKVFEPIRGKLRGWGIGDGLNKHGPTLYKRADIAGTFNTKFPKRVASLTVTDPSNEEEIGHQDGLGEEFGAPDIAFNFVLGWEKEEEPVTPRIDRNSNREYTFVVDGRQSFEELPPDLDFLRDAMDPNAVTPFLMLALVSYLEEDDTEMDAQEENKVEHFHDKLLTVALKSLFDKDLIENAPFDLPRTGKQSVEEVFLEAMEELYPQYHTIITTTQYEKMMNDYTDFISELETTSKRRGTNTVKGTKSEIAQLFGLKNTSPFDGRIKQHYSDIFEVVNDKEDEYVVRAQLHPFESKILELLEQSEDETINRTTVDNIAIENGYRKEEVEMMIKFLKHRGIVGEIESGSKLTLLETDVSIADVETSLTECKQLLQTIESLDDEFVPKGAPEKLDEIEADLGEAHSDDDEKLESLNVSTRHVKEQLDQQIKSLYQRYRAKCEDVKTEAERERRKINPDHLEEPIEGGVRFVGGLDDARRSLLGEYDEMKNRMNTIIDNLDEAIKTYNDVSVENAQALFEQAEEGREELDQILYEVSEGDEGESLEDLSEAVKRWELFTSKVAEVKRQIMDYAQTFEEEVDEEEEMRDFLGQVSESFADDWRSALRNLEGFEEQLNRIEESYKSRREERYEVFQTKLDILKEILDNATGGSSRGLRRTKYSFIEGPDEARRNLVNDFKEAYETQVIEKADENLSEANQEVEYARIVGVDAGAEEDPDEVDEQIEHTRSKLETLKSTLSRFTFTDIQEGNDPYEELSNDGREALKISSELHKTSREFRRETEPEDEAVKELQERINEHRELDFKELLMEYHNDGKNVDPDELLTRMNRLFQNNQIDIQISRRRGR